MRRDRRRGVLVLTLLVLLALPACKEVATDVPEGYEPSTLEAIEGTDLSKVILTAEAAERIELTTAPVSSAADGLSVPASAIWVDVEGIAWVYTNPEPLTYVRAEVEVDRYEGDIARLAEGPSAGTAVVTVGVPELIGSEFGV